jgi:cell division septation protein DedD
MPDQTEGRKRRWRVPVIAGATAALLAGTAAAAFAVVSPSPNTNTIGAGGYDVGTPGVTSNQEVINADQYGLTLAGGRQGVKMCNSTSNETSAIGLFSGNLNTDYAVQYGAGVVTCQPAGQLPAGDLVTLPGLSAVPFGHHVWINESLTTKVKTVRLLICVLESPGGKPVPTPTPTPIGTSTVTPTATPTGTSTVTVAPVTPTPTPTLTTTTPAPTPTTTYTTTPATTPTGTATASTTALVRHNGSDPSPGPSVTEPGGIPGNQLPGFIIKCHIVVRTFTVNKVVFEAQDLDAPTSPPAAGDLPGVQTAAVSVPAGTTFDHAVWGASENTTALVPCSGGGFPIAINTPGLTANYASAACQPLSVGEYATYNTGLTVNPLGPAAPITEVISPSAGGATMAPNGSLTSTNLGPHGTASDASTTGGHFVTFSANAPVS